MKRTICPVILAAAVFSLAVCCTACSGGGKTPETTTEASTETPTEAVTETSTESPKGDNMGAVTLKDLEGRWVDVNSETALDFKGDSMTVTLGNLDPEKFKVRVTDTPVQYIENTEKNIRDFGLMSTISIGEDGALTAYEMVLDADGHKFRFVRESELDSEKAVVDDSEDLPKHIESTDLETFSFSFDLEESWYDVPQTADSPWISGGYSIEIAKQGDGSYRQKFSGMGSSYVIVQDEKEVSEEYVQGLAELLVQEKVAENNGMHLWNSEDVTSWFLYAEYASGEKLILQASGRPALECPFSINAILDYVNQEVGFKGW